MCPLGIASVSRFAGAEKRFSGVAEAIGAETYLE